MSYQRLRNDQPARLLHPSSALEDRCQLLSEFRDAGLYDVPDEVVIDAEVVVDQAVSHPGNPAPLDGWVLSAEFRGSFFAASPMTSRLRTKARRSVSLEWNRSAVRPLDSWSLAGVLRTVPGVRINYTGGRTFEIAGRRGCPVTLYLDGMRIQAMTSDAIQLGELALPSQVVGVEVYPGMVGPLRFPGSSCGGSVVVWTGVPAR